MKVKLVSIRCSTQWYGKLLGEDFEVLDLLTSSYYQVIFCYCDPEKVKSSFRLETDHVEFLKNPRGFYLRKEECVAITYAPTAKRHHDFDRAMEIL